MIGLYRLWLGKRGDLGKRKKGKEEEGKEEKGKGKKEEAGKRGEVI